MASDINSRTYSVVSFLLVTGVIGFLSYRVLKPFLASIAWAIVLAVAFRPICRWLENRWPGRRGLAAAVLTAAVSIVVILPGGVFVGVLAGQAAEVFGKVARTLQEQHVQSFSDIVAIPRVAEALDSLQKRAGITPEDFQKSVAGFVTKVSGIAASLSASFVVGLFDAVITFFMTLVMLFFFLRDGPAMAWAAMELLPIDAAGQQTVGRSLQNMLQAIFRGSMLCALIQGAVGGIGWWIAGLPSPALASAAMAVLSLLPVGGTAIIWLPGVVALYLRGDFGWALFLFLWGAIVTSFLADNVLKPMLIRGAGELSTLVVFLGVFGGLGAFGLLGLFIGPIALAVALWLVEVMRALSKEAVAGRAPTGGTAAA